MLPVDYKNCTQWYSQVCFQSSKQEISDGLTRMMAVAMAQYKVGIDIIKYFLLYLINRHETAFYPNAL